MIVLNRKYLFLFGLIFFFAKLTAQEYPWVNYTTEDGLPTNYVYGAIEAEDGLIWIYTEDGLVKFDGYHFETFTIADGLPDNDVYFIQKDRGGICWLSTFGNSIAYLDQNKINRLSLDPNTVNGEVVMISGQAYRQHNAIFFSLKDDDPIKILTSEINDGVNSFKKVFKDSWISIDYVTKEVTFQAQNHPIRKFKSEVVGNISDPFLDDLINDLSPHLFVGAFIKGYFIYNAQSGSFQEFLWDDYEIDVVRTSFLHVLHPYIFINHGSGFIKINSDGEIVDEFIATDIMHNYEIRNFISDSKGNIWGGSRDRGLFFLSQHNRKNQKIWSSGNGANIIEKIIPLNDNKILFFSDENQPLLFNGNSIESLSGKQKKGTFKDALILPDGQVIASYSNNLNIWDQKLNDSKYLEQYSQVINNCQGDRKRYKKTVLNNLKSLAWDFTSNALLTNSRELMILKPGPNNSVALYDKPLRVKEMAQESGGGVWIGVSGIIYKHHHDQMDSVFSHPDLKYLTYLYEAEELLFIATEDKGLLRLNLKSKILTPIFSISNINNIGPGLNKSILLSTNNGVFRLERRSGKLIQHYKKSTGLSSNQVLDAYENELGLWVASSRGIDKIVDLEKSDQIKSFDLTLNSITVNNETINEIKNQIVLAAQQNSLKFNYNLLDYSSSGDITYFTKLSPLQNDWIASNKPEVSFIGLAPDSYTFELKAKRFNGQEIKYPNKINIEINPPFYKNPKTYVGLVILSFIGFYFFVKQKQSQYEKEKKLNKKISEIQLSALRSQMNPHFIFNALGAIQYYVQTKNTDLADDYLSEFALLMRRYLEASKQPTILLKDEIELLQLYTNIETMRFDHRFKTVFEIDRDLDLLDIRLPSVLVQPFVENAILHGLQARDIPGGLLKISFSQKVDALFVKITDNGIGWTQAQKHKDPLHKSRGLENIEDRIATLKIATGFQVNFSQRTPNQEDEKFPGHEVLIIFENLLA